MALQLMTGNLLIPCCAFLLTTSAFQLFYGKAYSFFSIKYTFILAIRHLRGGLPGLRARAVQHRADHRPCCRRPGRIRPLRRSSDNHRAIRFHLLPTRLLRLHGRHVRHRLSLRTAARGCLHRQADVAVVLLYQPTLRRRHRAGGAALLQAARPASDCQSVVPGEVKKNRLARSVLLHPVHRQPTASLTVGRLDVPVERRPHHRPVCGVRRHGHRVRARRVLEEG